MTDDLGPKPEPEPEAPELFPGGADAVDHEDRYHHTDPAVPDLHPAANPAVDDRSPDEISQPDDKQQEPDQDSGTESGDQPTEPPA